VAGYYQILNRVNAGPRRLRLRGLDPAATYRVAVWPESAAAPIRGGVRLGGDALMAAGLKIESTRTPSDVGDFHARVYVLEAE
jgi:hypothetical protein